MTRLLSAKMLSWLPATARVKADGRLGQLASRDARDTSASLLPMPTTSCGLHTREEFQVLTSNIYLFGSAPFTATPHHLPRSHHCPPRHRRYRDTFSRPIDAQHLYLLIWRTKPGFRGGRREGCKWSSLFFSCLASTPCTVQLRVHLMLILTLSPFSLGP